MYLWSLALATLMAMTLLAHDDALAAARDDCMAEAAYWTSGRMNKAFDDVDADAAVAACEEATTQQPDDAYLQALYCRALYKAELVLLAMEYCSYSARAGNPFGMTLLGNLYEYEVRQPGYQEKAFGWYLQSAKAGDSDGQFRAGRAYLYGIGTEKNLELAAQWLTASAQQGHPSGAMGLAMQKADIKQPNASRQRFQLALEQSADAFGVEHPYHSDTLATYIDWLTDAGLTEQALDEADLWLKRLQGDTTNHTHATVKLLAKKAALLNKQQNPKGALEQYRNAWALIQDDFVQRNSRIWFDVVQEKAGMERTLTLHDEAFATSLAAWNALDRLKLHDYQRDQVLCETMNQTQSVTTPKGIASCALY